MACESWFEFRVLSKGKNHNFFSLRFTFEQCTCPPVMIDTFITLKMNTLWQAECYYDSYEEIKAKTDYVCDVCGLIKYIYGSVYSLMLGWE